MKHLIVPFFILSLFCSTLVEGKNTPKIFSFETQPGLDKFWEKVSEGGGQINFERNYFIEGQSSWCLTGYRKVFHTNLHKYFNIPDDGRKVELSVYSQSSVMEGAWLKLWCLDIDENILQKDSISIINCDEWKKFTIKTGIPGTKKLYIEIEAKSNEIINPDLKDQQKLYIDDMDLLINGNKIDTIPGLTGDNKTDISAFEKSNSDSLIYRGIRSIRDFDKPKIIALGESVHGSDEMQHCSFETIKYLIEQKQCRLVLLELNFELGMLFNEYVSGEVAGENIEKRMLFYNYNYIRFMDLLNWIKEFNKTQKQKVVVSGIDISIFYCDLLGFDHLLDFIKSQKIDQDSIKLFFSSYAANDFEKAENWIKGNRFFSKLDKYKQDCIIRALELRQGKFNPIPSLNEGNREYVQFLNAQFAINSLLKDSDKAVIYAHLGHVNKTNVFTGRIYIPSFGNYMNRCYKDNYFVTALLVGTGTLCNTDQSGKVAGLPLVSPIQGSLEKICEDFNQPFLYKRTSEIGSVCCGRDLGAVYAQEQFYPYSHKNRFDAIIYFQHGNGYTVPDNWPKTREERMKYIDKQRVLNGREKWFK